MPSLRYHEKTGMWTAPGLDQDTAYRIGLDWSEPAGAYFTDNVYAALALWDIATPDARESMFMERMDWEASWAKEYTGTRSFLTPPGEELYPFQKAGVLYKLDRGNTLIADQPGLGKTAQAVVAANEMGAENVLVVCPASVRLQWREMFYRWTWPRKHRTSTGAPVANVILSSKDGVYRGRFPAWTFVSYDLLVRSKIVYELLLQRNFDMIIMDEIHYLKSYEAQRTRALLGSGGWEGLVGNAKVLLGLTGTPLPNRPRECYSVSRAFDWDAIDRMSEARFKSRFNPSRQFPTGHVEEDVYRLPELQNRLRCRFMARRLKREVLHQLPEVQYVPTYIEPNQGVRKALKAESLIGINPLHFDKTDMETQGHISTVRKEMGIAKVPLVVEHVARLLDGGIDKLVLFTWHREVLEKLRDELSGYGVVSVPGGVTSIQKHARKKAFMEKPGMRVFLGNILACGTGTDGLQEVCSHAVFAEFSWVPGDNDQAVDRLWRMGQTGSVMAEFLIAPDSMDEKVLTSAITKARTTYETLDQR